MTAKDAYYFSHDANARNDTKILAMRCVYGSEGYGLFWMLVEMMREQSDYKLDIRSKYAFHAIALQLHCELEKLKTFVSDCINEFNLFESDGDHFWSASLLRRMELKEEKSEKKRKNAEKRWGNTKSMQLHSNVDANAMQMHNDFDANAMQLQSNCNAIKVNKTKANIKDITKADISSLIKKYDIEMKGVYDLDQLRLYVDEMDAELIEEAFRRSKGKVSGYLLKVIDTWNGKGFVKLSDLKVVSKEDRERQARQKYLDDEIDMNRRFWDKNEPPVFPVVRATTPD